MYVCKTRKIWLLNSKIRKIYNVCLKSGQNVWSHVCGVWPAQKWSRAHTSHTCFKSLFARTPTRATAHRTCDRTSHVCVHARTFATHTLVFCKLFFLVCIPLINSLQSAFVIRPSSVHTRQILTFVRIGRLVLCHMHTRINIIGVILAAKITTSGAHII